MEHIVYKNKAHERVEFVKLMVYKTMVYKTMVYNMACEEIVKEHRYARGTLCPRACA